MLRVCIQQLKSVSDSPRMDAEILLSEALRLSKTELIAYPERFITKTEKKTLDRWMRRRVDGEPIAYIVGHQPFWTLDLLVTPETLIPRPETELLIEWILEEIPSQKLISVLDLGVGSGAIALALAKERPLWEIDAVDNSHAALAIAKKNAKRHAIHQVSFFYGSWFYPLPCDKKYALIVSNPPYIKREDAHLKKLRFEPMQALVAEQSGLADLESVINGAKSRLQPGGSLIVEHGFEQSDAVQRLMRERGYYEITPQRDLAQHPRFVTAKEDK